MNPSDIDKLENKIYKTTKDEVRQKFDRNLTHDSHMRFVLDALGISKEQTYAYDFKQRLEKLMDKNGLTEFVYANTTTIDGVPVPIIIHGRLVNGELQTSFLSPEESSSITKLSFLKDSEHYLVVKDESGWSLYDRKIDAGFVTQFSGNLLLGNRVLNNEEYKQVYNEFLEAGFSENPPKNDNKEAEKAFNAIANRLLEQLGNPFYQDTKYCVNLIHTKNRKTVFKRELKNGLDDKPCEVILNMYFTADGRVVIKHELTPDYLQDKVKKWEEEAKKRGLDIDIEELRQQVIKDFTALETERNFFKRHFQNVKALFSDKFAGYLEAIQATQKVAKNVWDKGTINRGMWHSTGDDAEEHKNFPEYMHVNGYVGGAIDGVVDEIVGFPQAIKGVYDIVNDPKQREALSNVFTKEGFGQLMDGLSKQAGEIAKDPERSQHFAGQTTVSVVSMAVPGFAITKVGKLGDAIGGASDAVKELVNPKVLDALDKLRKKERYNPKLGKAIESFLKTIDVKILDKLADAPGFGRVISDMGEWWTKFHGGKFALEYASKQIKKGKVLKFEVSNLSDDLKRIYDIVIEDVLPNGNKITKNLELKNWNKFFPDSIKKQFTKDLQKMDELGDIQWIFNKKGVNSTISELKENVIKSLKKADGSPIDELNVVKFEQVKKLFPTDNSIKPFNFKQKLIEKLQDDTIFEKIFTITDVK